MAGFKTRYLCVSLQSRQTNEECSYDPLAR